MNPLYNIIMSGQLGQTPGFSQQPMNPMQKMQLMMQAMTNPAAFVKRVFPDIPDQIQNNPNQVLQYLQQTRNIPDSQIQQLSQAYPYRG